MKKKLLILLILLAGTPPAFSASTSSPESIIQDLWQEMRSASADPAKEQDFVKEALRRNYDFQSFYKNSLQDHWIYWTENQKNQFDDRFEKYFLKSMAQKIHEIPKQGVTLRSVGRKTQENRAVLSFSGQRVPDNIQFKVYFSKINGEWKISDVEIEGALLSRNYRGQFNKILRKEQFEGLVARLDNSLSSNGGDL